MIATQFLPQHKINQDKTCKVAMYEVYVYNSLRRTGCQNLSLIAPCYGMGSMPICIHFCLLAGMVHLNQRLNLFSMSLSQPFHKLAGFENIKKLASFQGMFIHITCKANINKWGQTADPSSKALPIVPAHPSTASQPAMPPPVPDEGMGTGP